MKANWKTLLREWFHADEERSPVWPYIFISFLLHIIVSTSAWFLMQKTGNNLTPQDEVVEVLPLIENNGQYEIADIAPPAVEERPEKAKLLGMYDSSVTQETVATDRGEGERKNQADSQAKKAKTEPTKKANLYAFDKKIFAQDGLPASEINSNSSSQAAVESRGVQDYFPDYKRGANTYLNVMRFPDVEYFVRMKRIFRTTWNPIPSIRDHLLNNQLTSGKVEVVMAVSVDKNGNLAELFVLKPSGIPSYDNEALRTVRASSPFAQPPSKFLEKDGMLRMSWTFTQYL